MLKSRHIAHRLYEVTINGRTFTIDGQNHEFNSREWQLFEEFDHGMEWCETYPTKRDALIDLAQTIITRKGE